MLRDGVRLAQVSIGTLTRHSLSHLHHPIAPSPDPSSTDTRTISYLSYESIECRDVLPPTDMSSWEPVEPPAPGFGVAPSPRLRFLSAIPDRVQRLAPRPSQGPPTNVASDVAGAGAAATEPSMGTASVGASDERSQPASSGGCRSAPPRRIEVRGAGSAEVNGVYVLCVDPHSVAPMWRKVEDADVSVVHHDGAWWIGDPQPGTRDWYRCASDDPLPPINIRGAWTLVAHDTSLSGMASLPLPTIVVVPDGRSTPLVDEAAEFAASVGEWCSNHRVPYKIFFRDIGP